MYIKTVVGVILVQKSNGPPQWVQWRHHAVGITHCEVCLKLDLCYFTEDNHPPCPHHPHCHCTLEPIEFALVLLNAVAKSDYTKYDPYLFNTTGKYTHGKEKLFALWGYTVADAPWLQAEIERQGLEKYLSGDYELGLLNENGQHISIRVTIVRRDEAHFGDEVSFRARWMVHPNGRIQLATPYGGE